MEYFSDLILFEDHDIVVLNKPPGLLSLPDGYDQSIPSIYKMAKAHYQDHIYMVHRLDKDTSGVMILARTPESHKILNTQFENRSTQKEYHAIVYGCPQWEEFRLEASLHIDGDRNHRTIIDHTQGKPAFTDFFVIKRFLNYSLIGAIPGTGYTHQIRAHLKYLNLPILSDKLYGMKKRINMDTQIICRTALHATKLVILLPSSMDTKAFSAPYPADFEKAIDLLNQSIC